MELIDQFSGLGGWTEGARQAKVRVVWAGNHWRLAVETHEANHGDVGHTCQDLHQVDWTLLPSHNGFVSSPSCTGHTPARGHDRPRHDAARATAWAIVSCCEVWREEVGVVENVPAFLNWVLFPAWAEAMRRLGYSLAPHIIDAADHGVPQNRVRVYIVCTRSRRPLWLKLPRRKHVPVRSILDEGGEWAPIARMCRRTRERAAEGRREFGDSFVMPYYSSGSGLTGRSLDRPIGTITTRDRWAVVRGDRMRMLNVDECRRAMGFPARYKLPAQSTAAKMMLGNAVCPPVARDIITALKEAA